MPHQLALIPAAPRYWIAVASADHVARGIAGGFMQVCHGKRAPLARIRPGDGIIYYAPTQTFGTKTFRTPAASLRRPWRNPARRAVPGGDDG